MGNLDDDDATEIVLGPDRVPGNDGWLEVLDDMNSRFVHVRWFNLDWPEFRASGAGIYPAIGRR